MGDGETTFSKEQKRFLETDAFVSEVVKQRKGESSTKWWRSLFESAGGAALITIVLGGLATGMITNRFQERQAEREFTNRVVESFSANKLAATEKALQNRTEILNDGLTTVGNVITKSESRIDIDGPDFAKREDEAAEAINNADKMKARGEFNAAWEDWDTRKLSLEFSIGLYVGEESEQAWKALAERVDQFVHCANDHRPADNTDSCKEMRNEVQSAVRNFSVAARTSALGTTIVTREEVERIRAALER